MKKLLVALTIGLIAVSAMAQQGTTYGWWETYFTIAGQQFDVTTWSNDSSNGTDLGVLNLAGFVFSVSAVNGNIWSQAQDRDEMTIYFRTYINTVPAAINQPWMPGPSALTHVSGNDYTLTADASGPIGSPVLKDNDLVGIVMWAQTSGASGEEWYSDGGNNYHAFFTVGDPTPIPEPATMGLLGLGALAMVIRRKLSK